MELSQKEQKWIKKFNQCGKKSWIIYTVDVVDHDAFSRDEFGTPLCTGGGKPPAKMKRLRIKADGFTQLDAEIMPNGLRILYNTACKAKGLPEDQAWKFESLARNKITSWKKLFQHFCAYVQMSIMRAQGFKNLVFHPTTGTIEVKKW